MAALKPHVPLALIPQVCVPSSSSQMAISLLPQFFFISILLSPIICITIFTHAYTQCLHDQRTLLLELRNELIFTSFLSTKLVQWNQTDDCCSWEGVECDGAGHVISLQLDWEAISGGIDENSSSLFSLRYLKKLNLAYNNFNGTQIPRGISNLTYLTHLNLSNAAFGGQVPIELSLMRRLVSLDISNTYFVSHENPNSLTWYWGIRLKLEEPNLKMLLQNLTGLGELYLDSVDISAQKSEWYNIISSSLPDLRNLSLRYCGLSGPLDPSLSQFHSLIVLRLDRNNLSTVVPTFFANFSSLIELSLRSCSLKGSLDVSNNFSTGSHSSISFQGLVNLVYLDLGYNSLNGSIPLSLFFVLPSLEAFYLPNNQFSGQVNEFPALNFSNMRELDFGGNSLSGRIPQSLFSGLPSLEVLELSNNKFSGHIKEFATLNVPKLRWIDLRGNSLSGSIPQSLFSGVPSLEILDLSNNKFSGQVNEFPSLNVSNMRVLDLSLNRLEGPIPESFFQLESLESLSLYNNLFSGTFQLENIPRLRNLTWLDLSYNNLSVDASITNSSLSTFPELYLLRLASCNLYSVPDFIKQSSTMGYLDLSNNWIAGEIPSWIWEIGNGTLYHLDLSSNLFVDLQKPYKIPGSLQLLDLHSNQLQGELPLPVPPNLGNFTSSLGFFSLANNSLIGSIPTSLCSATNLAVLDLSVNKLTGNIPPCLPANIENLVVFNLGTNNISGDIPDKFSVNCGLKTLDLSNNNLEGNIPMSLRNCKSLAVMNVGNNNMSDSFPCMLSSSLRVLVLRSNRFHGEVRCQESWPNLQIIDVASNHFSGYLNPMNFSSWRGMMLDSDAQLRHNRSGFNVLSAAYFHPDEVTLTIKGLELKLVKIWPDFTSIDFSCNNFQGKIPDAIGDLSSLYLLNLSHNALTGTIPKSFGNLRQLGSLDLSVNQLAGTIPVELAVLTFLQVLNLSYNKLVGNIPIGSQLQTFPAASFEGNSGLCGLPLNVSCSDTDGLGNAQSHGKTEIEWDYVFAGLGYGVGLGTFFWVLLCCRSLRLKYFEKVDEVLETIFDRQDRRKRHGRRRGAVRNQVRRQ